MSCLYGLQLQLLCHIPDTAWVHSTGAEAATFDAKSEPSFPLLDTRCVVGRNTFIVWQLGHAVVDSPIWSTTDNRLGVASLLDGRVGHHGELWPSTQQDKVRPFLVAGDYRLSRGHWICDTGTVMASSLLCDTRV